TPTHSKVQTSSTMVRLSIGSLAVLGLFATLAIAAPAAAAAEQVAQRQQQGKVKPLWGGGIGGGGCWWAGPGCGVGRK
ncbi:hypothetical protein OC844_005610, partial [Tilletia horrida]